MIEKPCNSEYPFIILFSNLMTSTQSLTLSAYCHSPKHISTTFHTLTNRSVNFSSLFFLLSLLTWSMCSPVSNLSLVLCLPLPSPLPSLHSSPPQRIFLMVTSCLHHLYPLIHTLTHIFVFSTDLTSFIHLFFF